jgi:2-C-methyl-D-erythritol 4-phosphate cytidylyltransferase
VNVQLLVPAAGAGARLGSALPKALVDLAGEPLLVRTLRRFESVGLLANAVVVAPAAERARFEAALDKAFPGVPIRLVPGGAERQESVGLGLEALSPGTDVVVIHDAARPFISADSVRASIEAAAEHGAATVAIPAVDTILRADGEGFLESTPDRARLWACQTPQTFRVEVIRAAHAHARKERLHVTDDATLVRLAGGHVKLVMGAPLNFKVTTPADLAVAELIIREKLA